VLYFQEIARWAQYLKISLALQKKILKRIKDKKKTQKIKKSIKDKRK
jgi:hypothetical protein